MRTPRALLGPCGGLLWAVATLASFRLSPRAPEGAKGRSRSRSRRAAPGRDGRGGSASASRGAHVRLRGGGGRSSERGAAAARPAADAAPAPVAAAVQGARARGDRRTAQAEIGQTYGLPQDALDKLPTMELQLALKIIPVIAKAVLGNSFNIRQLMSTSYHTLLIDDDAEL
eukprot:9502911-Pyramimonas_sp.AAC.1